jgi:hypothetical protein
MGFAIAIVGGATTIGATTVGSALGIVISGGGLAERLGADRAVASAAGRAVGVVVSVDVGGVALSLLDTRTAPPPTTATTDATPMIFAAVAHATPVAVDVTSAPVAI